jgi:hypothetical protein
LTAWYGQTTDRSPLRDELYRQMVGAILALFQANTSAARIYQSRLASEVFNRPEGTYSEVTRSRLSALCREWVAGIAPEEVARNMLRGDRGSITPGDIARDLSYQG